MSALGIIAVAIAGLLSGIFARIAAYWLMREEPSVEDPRAGVKRAIEAVTAVLFLVIAIEFGATPSAALLAALTVGLVALSVIDLEIGIIPDIILLILAPLGVIHSFIAGSGGLDGITLSFMGGAFAGAVAYAVGYAFKRLRGRDALGLGDVKFFAVAGLWLGPLGLPVFMMLSGVAGIIFALIWRRLGGAREFPFGPSLALGLFLCLLYPGLIRILG